ncbi:MAG: glycosyltransferase family 2 protein [Prevotellaceae bacterium]|nr:glycosyltransferase family 2 protein [Prevotellaceae bacterium]
MKYWAVLLTVFNRKEKTLECLSRLFDQLPVEDLQIDVFLTDDGCTDGTAEAVESLFPSVHILEGSGELFWNRGMLMAWKAATETRNYDAYIWLNDDTYVYVDMLVSLTQAMKQTSERAILVGATEDASHSKLTYGGRLRGGRIPIPTDELTPVEYFNGNIVLVPRSAFLQLGYLDEYFTHSKGDYDYGLRAKKAGLLIYQIGKVLGECDEHPSFDKWCDPNVPFAQRWKLLNRPNGMPPRETFYFEKRHYGIIVACFHYLTVHIRCFFPKWWIRKNNPNVI